MCQLTRFIEQVFAVLKEGGDAGIYKVCELLRAGVTFFERPSFPRVDGSRL